MGEFLFSVSWALKECWVWTTLPWPLPGKWGGTASARWRNCPHLLTSGWSLSILCFLGWEKLQSEMTAALQGPRWSASSVGHSDICQRNLVAGEGMGCGWLLSTGTASLLGVLEVESPRVLATVRVVVGLLQGWQRYPHLWQCSVHGDTFIAAKARAGLSAKSLSRLCVYKES